MVCLLCQKSKLSSSKIKQSPSPQHSEIPQYYSYFTGIRKGPASGSGLPGPAQPLAASLPPISPLHHPDLPEAQLRPCQPLAPHHLWPLFPTTQAKLFMIRPHASHQPAMAHRFPREALPHHPDSPSPMLSMTPMASFTGSSLDLTFALRPFLAL